MPVSDGEKSIDELSFWQDMSELGLKIPGETPEEEYIAVGSIILELDAREILEAAADDGLA